MHHKIQTRAYFECWQHCCRQLKATCATMGQRTHLCDGVWNHNRREAGARTKSLGIDECDRVRNHNRRQANIKLERSTTDAGDSVADYDCGKVCAICKSHLGN